MKTELQNFALRVKEITAIELAIFDKNGKVVAGSVSDSETPPVICDRVVLDALTDRTFFPISFKNENYFCRIFGSGETQKNYSALIIELSSGFFGEEIELSLAQFYKGALLGEFNATQFSRLEKRFDIPKDKCCAILVDANGAFIEDVKNVILGFSSNPNDFVVEIDQNFCVLIKFEGKSKDYQPPTEFSCFLVQSVFEEIGVRIKLYIGGEADDLFSLSTSYTQALETEKMSILEKEKANVFSFKEYALEKMLKDLPKNKLKEYLNVLMDEKSKQIFDDDEMLITAEEFLENSLNVSETSRKLFLHRNTLIYRLDKIEAVTGLNIRQFRDALTFRLVTMLLNILK